MLSSSSILAYFVVTNVFCSSSLFIFVFSFCLHIATKRPALCCADHFLCSFVVAHVPAPYVSVGVSTASNRCSRCRRKCDWDISSCRCLANADQGHRIRCCTSVVPWSTNVNHLSQVLYCHIRRKDLDIHLADFDFSQLVCFLDCQDFGCVWVDFKFLRFRTFLKSAIMI